MYVTGKKPLLKGAHALGKGGGGGGPAVGGSVESLDNDNGEDSCAECYLIANSAVLNDKALLRLHSQPLCCNLVDDGVRLQLRDIIASNKHVHGLPMHRYQAPHTLRCFKLLPYTLLTAMTRCMRCSSSWPVLPLSSHDIG